MFERTPGDIVAGVLRFPLNGTEHVVPTLPWDASEEWQAGVWQELRTRTDANLEQLEDVFSLLRGSMAVIVELVAAYDRDHRLGRDAADLRQRFDRTQLYEVFKAIARHEFPFLADAQTVVGMAMPLIRPLLLQTMAGVASRMGGSSSSPSPSGGSIPEPSEPVSIVGRSEPSGKQARSA